MKAPKNRLKEFRVDCAACHATQDALRFACGECGNRLYSNMEEGEMVTISQQVADMEAALAAVEAPPPKQGNPYAPVDAAWAAYRALRGYTYLPGMVAYLDRVLAVLLPLKVRLMERTLKANWLFWIVLLAFPLITTAFGMHWTLSALLAMPATVWLLVTFKAMRDLRSARSRLQKINAA